MEGGVATGFKKVEKENVQRLLQVKGGFNPRVFTVSEVLILKKKYKLHVKILNYLAILARKI